MSKKRNYRYTQAPGSLHGTMRCTTCGRDIVSGQYRYFETTDAYRCQHRTCCADDPKWAALDIESAAAYQQTTDFYRACIEFKNKWSTCELDETIDELKEFAATPSTIKAEPTGEQL